MTYISKFGVFGRFVLTLWSFGLGSGQKLDLFQFNYKGIVTGSCTSYGYVPIFDPEECYHAVTQSKFPASPRLAATSNVTDVMDGCVSFLHRTGVRYISTNPAGTCDRASFDTFCDACDAHFPCFCRDETPQRRPPQLDAAPPPLPPEEGEKVVVADVPKPKPKPKPKRESFGDQKLIYVEVTSGTCESHGLYSIFNAEHCATAFNELGVGSGRESTTNVQDVIDGCTAYRSGTMKKFNLNEYGTCNEDKNGDYCRNCDETFSCLCRNIPPFGIDMEKETLTLVRHEMEFQKFTSGSCADYGDDWEMIEDADVCREALAAFDIFMEDTHVDAIADVSDGCVHSEGAFMGLFNPKGSCMKSVFPHICDKCSQLYPCLCKRITRTKEKVSHDRYRPVTKGKCEDYGYVSIFDTAACTEAVRAFGFDLPEEVQGLEYFDMTDGCIVAPERNIFFVNKLGSCDATVNPDLCGECSPKFPCICDTERPLFLEEQAQADIDADRDTDAVDAVAILPPDQPLSDQDAGLLPGPPLEKPEPTVVYHLVNSGLCKDSGYRPIFDPRECREAVQSTEFATSILAVALRKYADVPDGCVVSPDRRMGFVNGMGACDADKYPDRCSACDDEAMCLCAETVERAETWRRPEGMTYVIVEKGTCKDAGYFPIDRADYCEKAVEFVGLGRRANVLDVSVEDVINGCTFSTNREGITTAHVNADCNADKNPTFCNNCDSAYKCLCIVP